MKIQGKILSVVLVPVILSGLIAYIVSSMKLSEGVLKQAIAGMESTTIAVRELYYEATDGDKEVDPATATALFDSIKEQTGFDVTLYTGDTRAVTTITDATGNRIVGTTASEEVVAAVLQGGESLESDNIVIDGVRYVSEYVPLEHNGEIIGMLFMGDRYANLNATLKEAQRTVMLFIIIITVIAGLGGGYVGRIIALSIKKVAGYLAELREGKLNIEFDEKLLKRKDEVGEIARNVKNVDDRLIEIVDGIRENSVALNETSFTASDDAKKAHEMADQIDMAVGQIATTATTQAQDAEAAGESVEVIGRVIENTNVIMDDVTGAANDMSEASVSVKRTLHELNDSMESVKEAINTIQKQTEETNVSVQNIGEKANIITEIATQTNLLSLNASIEAARAGEMGRGFSVVASEIQKLAEQCNTSAVEIRETLVQLMENSDNSMETMNYVQNMIEQQEACLSQTNEAFGTVEGGIEKSVDGIKKINSGIVELSKARDNTIDVVQTVAAVAEENAASTEEAAASVEHVADIIGNLSGHVAGLRDVATSLQERISIFH